MRLNYGLWLVNNDNVLRFILLLKLIFTDIFITITILLIIILVVYFRKPHKSYDDET